MNLRSSYIIIVNMYSIESIPPCPFNNSLVTTELSNFFQHHIQFVSQAEILVSNHSISGIATISTATEPSNLTLSDPSITTSVAEPLSVTLSRLHPTAVLRETVGSLEAEFMQFNITSSGDIQQLKGKSVQQDNQLRLQRKTMDDLSSQLHHLKDDLSQQPSLIEKTAGRESIATEEKCQTL